jgi:hypothetical protein
VPVFGRGLYRREEASMGEIVINEAQVVCRARDDINEAIEIIQRVKLLMDSDRLSDALGNAIDELRGAKALIGRQYYGVDMS